MFWATTFLASEEQAIIVITFTNISQFTALDHELCLSFLIIVMMMNCVGYFFLILAHFASDF